MPEVATGAGPGLARRCGALLVLAAASAGFVFTVLWPLFAG